MVGAAEQGELEQMMCQKSEPPAEAKCMNQAVWILLISLLLFWGETGPGCSDCGMKVISVKQWR